LISRVFPTGGDRRVQIGILQSPLERGEREQNGNWLSFPPTASFPGSAATAEKIACPRFAADRIPICSRNRRLPGLRFDIAPPLERKYAMGAGARGML
jgi:hypothetical protein